MAIRSKPWLLRIMLGATLFALVLCSSCGKRAAAPGLGYESKSAPAPDMAEEAIEYEAASARKESVDAAKSPLSMSAAEAAPFTTPQIIYKASLTVETRSTSAARHKVEALAKEVGGYVSDTNSWVGEAGQEYVTITIRLPVQRFEEGLGRIRQLGQVKKESIEAQDVTEEFLDLEARLKTLRIAEERLEKMLQRSGKLADLLEIERELASRRGEIEQAEGRLRYLKNRVSYSTITVSLQEIGTAVVAPAGPYDVMYHLRSALRLLVSSLRGILTALIYIIIDGCIVWLPLLILLWLVVRRQRARQRE